MHNNLVEKRYRERLKKNRRKEDNKPKVVVELDEILPDIKTIKLDGEEKKAYVYEVFHEFYKRHIFIKNDPDEFFDLPVEFFTARNVKRLRQYVDISFDKILEDLKTGKRENILDSESYYSALRAKIKRRISSNRSANLKLTREESLKK